MLALGTIVTHDQYLDELFRLLDGRLIDEAQMLALLIQKAHFDARRRDIERQHRNRVVGFIDAQMYVETDLHALIERATPDHPAYFEPVGFDLI